MTYAPKHAKPTSLTVAVLGIRADQSGSEGRSDADGAPDQVPVPQPRAAADEKADQPAA